jgi:hypothetical protein
LNVSRRISSRARYREPQARRWPTGVLIEGARVDPEHRHRRGLGHGGLIPLPRSAPGRGCSPLPADKHTFACVAAALDGTAEGRAGLSGLTRSPPALARFLTTGGAPPDLGVGQPPSDGDVLGHVVPADRLTVTLSVGSSPCPPPLHRLPAGCPAAVRNWAAAADQRAARRLCPAVRRRVLLHSDRRARHVRLVWPGHAQLI